MMRTVLNISLLAVALALVSCAKMEEVSPSGSRQVGFEVTVSRGGVPTKADWQLEMDPNIPFGLVGIDPQNQTLLIDNEPVARQSGGAYGLYLDNGLWEASHPVSLSAYYPYVRDIRYAGSYESYSIPYTAEETEAGPLVSKTVQMAVDQMNMVPLRFQHITNDIGYAICDATEDPQLQGLIHLRKVTATNVAQAGVFENDIALSNGIWYRQGYYRDMVVFEGDALLGVGAKEERFIGDHELVSQKELSHRYYSIPDEIVMGKQTVDVVYDVDSFTVGEFTYPPLKGLTARFCLYGLLPGNTFVYGKQYTFHLGLDLGKVYQEIVFSASVSGWDTKIYEDNEDF